MVSKPSVFLDTNVILDVLLKREGLFEASSKLLSLSEKKIIDLKTSIITYATIFYFVKKGLSRVEFVKKMKYLRSLVGILPSNDHTVDLAWESNFYDFEDAIQNQIAESNGLKTIITRNKKDFKNSNLSILTPEEFLIAIS